MGVRERKRQDSPPLITPGGHVLLFLFEKLRGGSLLPFLLGCELSRKTSELVQRPFSPFDMQIFPSITLLNPPPAAISLAAHSSLSCSCGSPSSPPTSSSYFAPPAPLYSPAGQEWPGRAMCFQSGLDRKSKQGFCVYQATAPSPCSYSHLEALANW